MTSLRTITLCFALMTCVTDLYAQETPTRDITRVAGDLYRFQNNNHYSVFLVTSEGIIATDPIDEQAARWLDAQLQERFGQKVKYLIYSHDHWDHVSGGQVFDEAIVVSHVNTKEKIIGERRDTAVPTVTFSESMTVTLGGSTVHLLYLGKNHSDNSTAILFPDERALFAVDFISVDRMPWGTLNDSYVPDWFESLRRVEALDFDIMLPGHGVVGTREDVSEHRLYLEALYEAVLKGVRDGKSLEALQNELSFDAYGHFEMYEMARPMNIEGMYRLVSASRIGN